MSLIGIAILLSSNAGVGASATTPATLSQCLVDNTPTYGAPPFKN
jgi:hypothetical protein